MVKFQSLTTADLLKILPGKLVREGVSAVSALAEPGDADASAIAFIIGEAFIADAEASNAGILVVQTAFVEKVLAVQGSKNTSATVIACDDAYTALARLSQKIADQEPLLWDGREDRSMLRGYVGSAERGFGPGAWIHDSAQVDSSAEVAPGVVVGPRAVVGARTQLLANVAIGPGVVVGSDCVFYPGVAVYARAKIGNRVRLHANVVIGGDGFGYARGATGATKIWHLGTIIVQDDVEVGAGTTIDRGTIRDTIVERNAKIDNLCQIGHNAHIKSHAILCGHVGMAGNVTVGHGAILAGKAGIADKVVIGDGAIVGPMTGVSKDVPAKEQVMSAFTAQPRKKWWRMLVYFERLADMADRIKKLEEKVNK